MVVCLPVGGQGTHMLLNWNEVEIRDTKIIIIPLGIVEQHVRFIIPLFFPTKPLHELKFLLPYPQSPTAQWSLL